MSLLIQAQTSENDQEITECLDFVLNSAKLGLVHESVDVGRISAYTRKYWRAIRHNYLANNKIQEAGSHVRYSKADLW